jgi:phosphoribosylglycinamide formyltransferase 1
MPALDNPSDPNLPSEPDLEIRWPLPPPLILQRHRQRPWRLAVLASGAGTNFEALVQACHSGALAAEVVQLVVNNPGCGAELRAQRLGVPCRQLNHRHYSSREQLDRALVAALQACGAELVVMAGWMRIVTPVLIAAFPGRLLNIHPSLLPAFRGLDAVGQALAAGVTLAGCTAHLVSEAVDSGEILMQAAVPVCSGDDHATLSARIQRQEHRLLPAAVDLLTRRLAFERQGPQG